MQTDELAEHLAGIKGLLVLWLLKAGATQTEIGMALGIDQSAVSRLFKRKAKITRFRSGSGTA